MTRYVARERGGKTGQLQRLGLRRSGLCRWRPEYGYFAKQAGFTVKTSPALLLYGR